VHFHGDIRSRADSPVQTQETLNAHHGMRESQPSNPEIR
jgi:hypothetical protein